MNKTSALRLKATVVAIGALAGVMVVLYYGLGHYFMGFMLGLKAFTSRFPTRHIQKLAGQADKALRFPLHSGNDFFASSAGQVGAQQQTGAGFQCRQGCA